MKCHKSTFPRIRRTLFTFTAGLSVIDLLNKYKAQAWTYPPNELMKGRMMLALSGPIGGSACQSPCKTRRWDEITKCFRRGWRSRGGPDSTLGVSSRGPHVTYLKFIHTKRPASTGPGARSPTQFLGIILSTREPTAKLIPRDVRLFQEGNGQ